MVPEIDAYGNLIMEPAYEMRYLLSDGTEITKEEYKNLFLKGSTPPNVYRVAFVSCTYHCG